MKNKFKSYSFWTALAAAVVVLVEAIGRIFGFIPDGKLVSDIIMAIAGVLVVLGVVSAPISKETTEESEVENPFVSNEEEILEDNKTQENKNETKEE